jgi:hypothetical protein
MIFVTAVNERYKPGAIALWNSFKRFHKSPHEFWCLVFGSTELTMELAGKGMNVMQNPHYPPVKLPAPGVWDAEHIDEDALKALYARLFLPEWFCDEERICWIDADSNFVRAASELDRFNMNGKSIAAPLTGKIPKIFKAMDEKCTSKNIKTGTILYDVRNYLNRLHPITMAAFIKSHGDKFDASTCNCAINYIIKDDVEHLPDLYSYNAKRGMNPEARILHWSICEPWDCESKPLGIQKQIKKYWEPYVA